MASKRTSAVEIPGEAAAPDESTPPAAEGATTSPSQEGDASATAAPNPLAPAVPLQSPTLADSAVADQAKGQELARQVEVLNNARTGKGPALVGGPALDWSHLTQPSAIMAKIGVDPEAHLPQPEQVDWSKTTEDRVLTKQGWLLRR